MSTRMAKINKTDNTKSWQGYGKLEVHTLLVGMQNGKRVLII